MQGMFYGGFQGKKRYMLPLLSKIGAERENTDNMMGYIFQSIQLPENFEQLGDDDWVKALFTSGGSMNINYLEGGLFEDLSSYLLEVEGLTCTRTLDYGVNTYFYSGYDSLEIQRFERKSDARWTANSSEKEMGHPSLLKEKLEWSDGLNCNAAQLIPNIVLPPVVKEESPFVINKNGVLVKYTGTEEEVVIPKECKSIGTRAFQNNESLKRVIIPKGVIEVGESAFYRCTALEYLELPEKLKKIGEFAFAGTALEKVELPEGLKTLGRWAFDAKLKELTIPASLGSLNEYSYGDFELEDYFRNLEKINVAEGNKNYYVKEGVLYRAKAKGDILLCGTKAVTGEVIVPDGVREIARKAFSYNDGLTSIQLPESVKKIGERAFMSCHSLTKIHLPDSLEEIESGTFEYCKKLVSITLPKNLKTIEMLMFSDCESLTEIILPEGLKKIKYGAFTGCKNLKRVKIPDSVVEISDSFDTDTVLEADVSVVAVRNLLATSTQKVELFVTSGRDYTNMVTPAVLESLIRQNKLEAFTLLEPFAPELNEWFDDLLRCARYYNVTQMETYLLEKKSVTEAGKKPKAPTIAQLKKIWTVHDNKDGTVSIRGYKGGFSHLVVPEMIGKKPVVEVVLEDIVLRSIVLPTGLKTSPSFRGISTLEYIEIGEDAKVFSSKDGILYDQTGKTLLYCPRGRKKNCVLPEGIVKIEWKAFSGCAALEHIVLPAGLRIIESFVFYQCENLTNIIIPDGVKKLESYTFGDCWDLTGLTLPASITEIDESAFGRNRRITIHAPAGSFAEEFAKKNNIAFVAE